MVKKLNELGVTIKKLLAQGFSQIWIARQLKIRRQKVNYWAKNPIKTEQKRRRKLEDKYIKEIVTLAENKTTSSMSSNKIANIINKKLKEDGLNLSVTKMTVCRILNKELGKPRKIKRVFYLSKKNKMKRVEFCKKMIAKNITGKNFEETKIREINDSRAAEKMKKYNKNNIDDDDSSEDSLDGWDIGTK